MTNEKILKANNYKENGISPPVFFNACFDKNHLKTVIAWFLEQYGEKVTIDLVEILKQVGFHQATLAGVSLGVDDLKIPPQKAIALSQASVKMGEVKNAIQSGTLTSVEKSQRLIDTWNQTSDTLRQNAVQNFRTTNPVNPVYMMAFSGARGNISQVRQLVAMRGLMADPQGAILEFPIQSNFREGLTITEYLISCYGARKGLVDTALRTATSGYLTRRLVDAVQHVVVHVTDCRTNKGIFIRDKNIEQRLIGRVLLEDVNLDSTNLIPKNTLISQNLAKRIAANHQKILVRSPLTCNTEKSVCQLCYGLDLAQGKIVSLGEAVGILAAQSIGEPGTQLTMRTFHTGGVGVFSDQAMKAFLAPFEGKIEFVQNLPGLFVRTPHGNIVYLLKHTTSKENTPLLRLHSFSSSQVYEITDTDVPSGSLLWVKQGELVKAGDLLLQASRFENPAQEMPESSHPVSSPFSGEVYFQSMKIRTIEEEKITSQKTKKKKQEESTNSQTNEKEISPTFRTLVDLGNFWVFSSFVQKESSFSDRFFRKGDLLSSDTPIFQYNIHLPFKAQLKKFNSALIIGKNSVDFLLSKISYSHLFYVLMETRQKTNQGSATQPNLFCEKNIVLSTNSSKHSLLTWYPFLQNFPIQPLGYCSILRNPADAFHQGTYSWSKQKVVLLKNLQPLVKTSCFLVTCAGLSKNGIFQVEVDDTIKWSKKSLFSQEIQKNSSKNQHILCSLFIQKSLNRSRFLIAKKSKKTGIQKKHGWFYVPERNIIRDVPSQLSSVLLEPGKTFEKLSFPNSTISVQFLANKNIVFFKSHGRNQKFFSYSLEELLNSKRFTNSDFAVFPKEKLTDIAFLTFNKQSSQRFCFYKKQTKNFIRNQIGTFPTNIHGPKNLIGQKNFVFGKGAGVNSLGTINLGCTFQLKQKRRIPYIIFLHKNYQQIVPEIKFFKENWLLQKKASFNFSIHSPISTKQFPTSFDSTEKIKTQFKVLTPVNSGYFSVPNFLKLQIEFGFPKGAKKREQLTKKMTLTKTAFFSTGEFGKSLGQMCVVPGFSLMFFRNLKLQNSNTYNFQTFDNSWILPEFKITRTFRKSEKFGEFQRLQKKQKQNFLSLLRTQDLITIKIPVRGVQKVGSVVRWGEEFCPNFSLPKSGQILKIKSNAVTLRKGIPLLASPRGLVHVFHNDIVEKNDLVLTLKSRRLQTEDIVQGIPKIEQLFEARETQGGELIENNMHVLLQTFFNEVAQSKPFREAVDLSLAYIQNFLVENILAAYSNQGVHIAEKHVEVVVRQMTARVRITSGGDSGFLPGEFIQHRWIEKVNLRLVQEGRREARYEPVILGITKSVLQSESFLVAASFQQVSKVLIRSALSKKTDFLRGLHENILVGQPIPAGTGLISRVKLEETLSTSFEKTNSTQANC